MEFAKKQLEKYGWTEGDGLGKEGKGRVHPVRAKIKRDYGGVGLEPGGDVAGQWWNKMFDAAARNITVTTDKGGGVAVQHKQEPDEDLLCAVNRRYRHTLVYSDFVKSVGVPERLSSPDLSTSTQRQEAVMAPSDVDLWKACSGRTAHKAARHGMKLSGKLKRLEEQDTQLSVTKDVAVGKSTASHVTKDKDTANHVTNDARSHVTKEPFYCAAEEVDDTLSHVTDTKGFQRVKRHKRC